MSPELNDGQFQFHAHTCERKAIGWKARETAQDITIIDRDLRPSVPMNVRKHENKSLRVLEVLNCL